jgi:hypothetical protein
MTQNKHTTDTEPDFQTVDDAIEHMENATDDHLPYEIRSGSERVDTVTVNAPSIITEDEWYELGEEPARKYEARCTCGATHTSWGAALRCTDDQ